jgi:hypothetical protein
MASTLFDRLGPAAVFSAALLACATVPSAWAGGGGHGGPMMRPGGGMPGWHGGRGASRFPAGTGAQLGSRGLPPLSGVIHERPGMRPYLSRYGHTNTAAGGSGYGRIAAGGYGQGGERRGGLAQGAYGHTATGLRAFVPFRPGFARYGRGRAFAERFRLGRAGARFAGGFGGGGLGYGDLGYGYVGGTGGGIPYGVVGGYGGGASYGSEDTYAGSSTATQVGSYGGTYRSETPLAASFAEPPLAPSPGSGYDTANRYAYAASDDVPSAARIVSVDRASRRGCDCGPRIHTDPIIYRYGVGTAY